MAYTLERLEKENKDLFNLYKANLRLTSDTIYILSGKWRLWVMLSLYIEEKQFNEIEKDLENITKRMLSRELKILIINDLVSKVEVNGVYRFRLSAHAHNLVKDVMFPMIHWAKDHRKILKNS